MLGFFVVCATFERSIPPLPATVPSLWGRLNHPRFFHRGMVKYCGWFKNRKSSVGYGPQDAGLHCCGAHIFIIDGQSLPPRRALSYTNESTIARGVKTDAALTRGAGTRWWSWWSRHCCPVVGAWR